MTYFSYSVRVDLRQIRPSGKDFKLLADLIRAGVKNEHGFSALKGLTDQRLKQWPVAIRFKTAKNRESFYNGIQRLLRPTLVKIIGLKPSYPNTNKSKPIKYIRSK